MATTTTTASAGSLTAISRTRLLTPAEELQLARRIERGDLAAKDRLVQANLRLVVHVAKRYQREEHGLSLADLVQEGTVGLRAGGGEVRPPPRLPLLHLRHDLDPPVDRPRDQRQGPRDPAADPRRAARAPARPRGAPAAPPRSGASPTPAELAAALEWPPEEVAQRRASCAAASLSLHEACRRRRRQPRPSSATCCAEDEDRGARRARRGSPPCAPRWRSALEHLEVRERTRRRGRATGLTTTRPPSPRPRGVLGHAGATRSAARGARAAQAPRRAADARRSPLPGLSRAESMEFVLMLCAACTRPRWVTPIAVLPYGSSRAPPVSCATRSSRRRRSSALRGT